MHLAAYRSNYESGGFVTHRPVGKNPFRAEQSQSKQDAKSCT